MFNNDSMKENLDSGGADQIHKARRGTDYNSVNV